MNLPWHWAWSYKRPWLIEHCEKIFLHLHVEWHTLMSLTTGQRFKLISNTDTGISQDQWLPINDLIFPCFMRLHFFLDATDNLHLPKFSNRVQYTVNLYFSGTIVQSEHDRNISGPKLHVGTVLQAPVCFSHFQHDFIYTAAVNYCYYLTGDHNQH